VLEHTDRVHYMKFARFTSPLDAIGEIHWSVTKQPPGEHHNNSSLF